MFYEFNHLGSPDYLKIERNRNFSFPLHLHQCFEIIIILSGEMTVTVDTQSFLLKKQEALLIFPNQIHSLHSTESEHILCIFSPRLVQAFTTKVAGKTPKRNLFRPDRYLIHTLEQLNSDVSSVEKKGLLYSLCGQFNKSADYDAKQADSQKLLHKIFSFVEKEFSSDCSLHKLANTTGYDYSYLSRYFKKAIGISFNSYVTHYRLSHACYLLENTNLPILQCAYDSGFTSLRNFNRCFQTQLNTSPSQYRKKMNL